MRCADARSTAAAAAKRSPAWSPAPARARPAAPPAGSRGRAARCRPSASGCRTPYAGQPGLLLARQPGGPVIVLQLAEAGGGQQRAPRGQVVVGAVAAAVPAFLVVAARIGAEQRAARPQCGAQLAKHARQFLERNVE